ncbi:hypothetical protein SAICODRAFT_91654 [Saitoella complicata NRRL Y-17804]|uniref:PRISE-like Rossmann-fold domain-containing protein n=1 Tax=Saitoella complicata (strain BCRC 22490 / CBS 7301 / JCM 7358 / NBRC 10748 / NRRL Y-17804) TaxID=698492 RepID=A0A0E9NM13_SAICN|nr:uncharacterized protein SAICODRAFT_91654 [Saitoella complicata NRRL Y-17804]ODQ53728.1 hypothetical protein SAICODRAFT_91654 [Saitoella complicata NRRL Y-17804]GAO50907.1 hypothetical protein G7K_5026-t1 [Saitoella complicata NRRL Y-17804]
MRNAPSKPITDRVYSNGLFHGLPVLDAIKGQSAIVAGANGISGVHMLRILSKAPERWSEIHSLSRRPLQENFGENVKHTAVDFLDTSPEEIAEKLKEGNVKGDYVFFFAYVQPREEGQGLWSMAEKMCEVNGKLLSNFLAALTIADIHPKRIILQTGAKHYGYHLGPAKCPSHETDSRVDIEPNFYYTQEDILEKWCNENNCTWSVARPSFILGSVQGNAMNVAIPLGIYAAVQKALGRNLHFPGDIRAWDTIQDQSSAYLNAYFEEWCALSESCDNESFNLTDGSPFSYGKFWPKLAERYGLEYTKPSEKGVYQKVDMPYDPPPRGFGPPGVAKMSFTLAQWARAPEVQEAFNKLAKEQGLDTWAMKEENIDAVFSFTDYAICWSWPLMLSMDKARKYGFFGFVDSYDSYLATFEEAAEMKLIPKV